MDPRLKHPFSAIVAGPSGSGKTQLLRRILEKGEHVINGAPQRILWCYGIHQPLYDEMQNTIPNIDFIEGFPNELESQLDPTIRNYIIIDDMMH